MIAVRPPAVVLAVAGAALLLTSGCTSSGAPTPSRPASRSSTAASSPRPVPTTPIESGPTTAAAAKSCPFVSTPFVHNTIGMRLSRVTVLRSGGRIVGCRFYALQDSSLHNSEHLPGPHQPAAQITTERYASADVAHNAFVLAGRRGTEEQRQQLGARLGVCFRDDFDPHDHGQDAACTTNVGTTTVLVQTVDTTGTDNTITLITEVLRHV
jgi:hypothetical protein